MSSPTETEGAGSQGRRRRSELEENLEILRNVPAFAGIPLERLKLYAYLSRRIPYGEGEFLFRQGERDDRGYIVISGQAQLVREYANHSAFLEILNEGDFFGGLALLADIRRLFSAKAITPVECLTLDRESFRKLLVQFPELAIKVLEVMIKRIARMEEKLMNRAIPDDLLTSPRDQPIDT
jgi:CRP-like cAMP-binding protein